MRKVKRRPRYIVSKIIRGGDTNEKWILKFYENDVIRYIFWGGCTTLVNLLSFYIMRAMGIR